PHTHRHTHTHKAPMRILVIVSLLGLVILSAAYPSYIYVDEPMLETVASPQTSERFDIRPRATKKNLIGPAVNGHMLKQPLLRFDILWRKFAPNSKRSLRDF
ncbi:hypothetical protein PFISCL1PPCAC_28145, partial [Pristionchus fissidentatus]